MKEHFYIFAYVAFIIILLTGPNDLLDLVHELREVVGWYDLGLYLSVPRHVLETIKVDYQSNDERKKAVFCWWLNNTLDKKWSAVVLALSKSGYRYLAEKIAMKYGKLHSFYT